MKAYSISVQFDMPGAGVITVAAETKEQAEQKIKAQLANYRNVVIMDNVELPDVSSLLQNMMEFDDPVDDSSSSIN